MAEEGSLFVARPEDLDAVRTRWERAKEGSPQYLRLAAPFGGGRRALAAELVKEVRASSDDVILWRVQCSDQENGVQWLMRMYGSLIGHIVGDVLLRGKVEMVLNGQLPSETKRVQGWFEQFVTSLREAKPDAQSGQIQLRISQDNPLVGLVEVVRAISRKVPILLELQQPYLAHTVLVSQFLEVLQSELGEGHKLFTVVFDEVDSELRSSTHPAALLDLWSRKPDAYERMTLGAWGEAEVNAFLDAKGVSSDAARIAAIAKGRPGFVAELVEILEERDLLGSDLSEVSLGSLVPMDIDEDELDVPDKPPAEGERKHAGPDDAGQIAFLAALLGQAFPSALVAEMGGYAKESVDDLIDAMENLFEEVQFNEGMNTWVYRFKRGSWREGIVEQNDTDEGHALARRVGAFMERFLAPRGLGFTSRTCRIYGEHGAPQRAQQMRALALTNDDANTWGLAYELVRYFDEIDWPETLQRTIDMTLLDHLVSSGPIQAAERVHTQVTEAATAKGDRELQGWLLLNGSKLDLRRRDLYRARDRARDALTIFEALEAKPRIAEVHAHLASVALADGKDDEALEAADAALTAATSEGEDGKKVVGPTIAAQAELVRGSVHRRKSDFDKAIEHFKKANEIAGAAGIAALAIDAGLAMGESMLQARQIDPARDVLQRVMVATRQVGALARERQVAELLAQAEAARRNFGQALALSQRCLQISQQQNNEGAAAVDSYHVGFFHLTQNQGGQALPFFKAAEQTLSKQAGHPLMKDLWYHTGLAALQAKKLDEAVAYLDKAKAPLTAAQEWNKLVSALDQIAKVAEVSGDKDKAKTVLSEALGLATQHDLKDARKALAKRLEGLG